MCHSGIVVRSPVTRDTVLGTLCTHLPPDLSVIPRLPALYPFLTTVAGGPVIFCLGPLPRGGGLAVLVNLRLRACLTQPAVATAQALRLCLADVVLTVGIVLCGHVSIVVG